MPGPDPGLGLSVLASHGELVGAGPRVTVSPPKRVSLYLRNLRRKKRMSQAALAAKAGFSREYVARPETGHHDPRLSILAKHAEALGVPVTKLLDREER